MGVLVGDAVVGGHATEFGKAQVTTGQGNRIDPGQQGRQLPPTLGEGHLDEGPVKGHVVGDDEVDADEAVGDGVDDVGKERGVGEIPLAQARETGDETWHGHRRAHQRLEGLQLPTAPLHRDAKLDDVFDSRRQASGFDVDDGEAQLGEGTGRHTTVCPVLRRLPRTERAWAWHGLRSSQRCVDV